MSSRARDLDLLSFGEAIIDLFPANPGLPLGEVEVFHRHLGGAPCNVAVNLSRLGLRVGLMTMVGDDEFGRFVRRRLTLEGVDASTVGTHRSARTGITFVAVAADGERSFLSYRGGAGMPAADQLIAESDVDAAAVQRARIFHFGSSTMAREPSRAATRKALAAALEGGALISIDPNWRAHLWDDPSAAPQLLRELVARADVLKISDDELGPIVGTSDPKLGARTLRGFGAGLVVVTRGARGCYFDAPCGAGFLDGERVPVIDTTGAGDAFAAGLLASLMPAFAEGRAVADLELGSVRLACTAGNRAGARAVTHLGALARLADESARGDGPP